MEIKVVDVQSHVFPKDYAELLCKSKSKVRGTKITENKYAVDYFNGMYTFYIDLEKYEPDLILEKMEKSRIDAGLISVNIPTPDLLDEELKRRKHSFVFEEGIPIIDDKAAQETGIFGNAN